MPKAAQPDPSTLVRLQSNISVQRYFEISLLLTLATGFITVAMTGKLDFVSTVVVSLALGVKLWGYFREADFSLSPRTVTRISIFYIFFYALDFLIFSPGPGLAGQDADRHRPPYPVHHGDQNLLRPDLSRLRLTSHAFFHDDAGQRHPDGQHDLSGVLHPLRHPGHLDFHQLRNQARAWSRRHARRKALSENPLKTGLPSKAR